MSLCDKWLSGFYGKLPYEDYSLLDRAVRTLLSNIRISTKENAFPWSPWRGISPAPGFKGIWNWDSAFHAIGVSRWDTELAREQIAMFLDLQLPSGLLPDVLFDDGSLVDNFGKPPVMPWAAATVDMRQANDTFLARAYGSFVLNEAYWRKNRGGDRNGLFNYDSDHHDPTTRLEQAKYESGWDNAVRWDGGIYEVWPVDLNCFMVMLYRALTYMAKRLNRPEEVERWNAAGCNLSTLIEKRLWDEKTGSYLDYDFGRGQFIDALGPASFMPLYIGTASQDRAQTMAQISTRLCPGWPTVAYDHPKFDPTGYWRGRTWLNVAYFALKGLKDYEFDEIADAGKKTILDWVRDNPSQIHENYNPETGAPLGAPQFSWSAVFVMEFILNWNKA